MYRTNPPAVPPPPKHPDFGAFFSARFDAWAERTGKTRMDLAAALEVDISFVSRLITGHSRLNPQGSRFSQACKALDLSKDDAREMLALCGVDLGAIGVRRKAA